MLLFAYTTPYIKLLPLFRRLFIAFSKVMYKLICHIHQFFRTKIRTHNIIHSNKPSLVFQADLDQPINNCFMSNIDQLSCPRDISQPPKITHTPTITTHSKLLVTLLCIAICDIFLFHITTRVAHSQSVKQQIFIESYVNSIISASKVSQDGRRQPVRQSRIYMFEFVFVYEIAFYTLLIDSPTSS